MPGNRVSAQSIIPVEHQCDISSDRRCVEQQAHDSTKSHRFKSNKSQLSPIDQNQCNCSLDSLCVGIVNNRSICLCRLTKMSPRRFLGSICKNNMCMNEDVCAPYNDRISFTEFTCLNECRNEAQRFQDNPICPTKIMCVCRECFYATQCQFTT
ncbi:unnamed protein product [Rotaria magnacalcarata]|uniref:Uncharacterized protein n=1 Tax=Rotaria magnacalcarata TaxID=392030 RepID=A0A8S2MME2_9BILA|nr:unnamed protein product [Rotaria magnacalcarata]